MQTIAGGWLRPRSLPATEKFSCRPPGLQNFSLSPSRPVASKAYIAPEDHLRKLSLIAVLVLPSLIQGTLHAQQFDVAFGVGTLTAPSASSASGNHNPVSITGGAYPVFSADLLLKNRFGVSGELAWRASRNLYAGFQPYRPLFYDFNGIYAPKLGKSAAAELSAGIGWESLRFYQGFTTCGAISCTDFVSSNHFMGHFGAGLRYYFHGHFFVRPEADLYLINNNQEFSSARATRFGVSLGYSFTPGF
jgi:Outer membrane protein beta-barrel domain